MNIKLPLTIIFVLALNLLFAAPQITFDSDQSKQPDKINATDVVKQLNSGERGNGIAFSPEYVFSSDNIAYPSAGTLDSLHFVVAYTTGYSYAVVGTIDGNTITYGDEHLFNDGNVTAYSSEYISVAVLDATHFIIAYSDRGDSYSNAGTVVLGTVIGDSISYSPEYVFNPNSTYYTSAATLSSNKFVIAYSQNNGKSIIGTVSGNSISFGQEKILNVGITAEISATSLNQSKFIVCYRDYESNKYGKAVVGNVSGTTITYGPETTFAQNNYADPCATTTMDENHFVVAYQGLVNIGTVSGNNISLGTGLPFITNNNAEYFSIATLDSANFVLTYKQQSQAGGKAIIGTIANSNIYLSQEVFYTQQAINIQSVTSLGPNEFVVAFNEYNPDDYGIGIIGNVFEKPVTTTIYNTVKCVGNDSITVPVTIMDMENISKFSLTINYDNTNLLFENCTNLNPQLSSGQLTTIENNGEITVSWESDTSAFILNSDTLFDLLFSIQIDTNYKTEDIFWDEENSYYEKQNGEYAEDEYVDGQIITLAPDKPEGPIIIDLNNLEVAEYTTNIVEDATEYQWFIDPPEAGVIFGTGTVGTAGWNANYTGLSAFVYVIATTDKCGPTASDSLEVSIGYVGLRDMSGDGIKIELFPNPNNGQFKLFIKDATNELTLKVINARGEIVHKENLKITAIDFVHDLNLASCQSGIYYVQLISNNAVTVKKLIVR
jgi:Secretion system C-terminal sorting domain